MSKILITSEALTLDRTSEGICTSKFIIMLKRAGHQVICLTSEPQLADKIGQFYVSWLPDIPIINISSFRKQHKNVRIHLKSKILTLFNNKLEASISYFSGFSPSMWREIGAWKNAIRESIKEYSPDLIFVRGAGQGFLPHLAMTQWNSPIPWVANYHDPFPVSLYPEPYRKVRRLLSWRQESWNEKILLRASRITFPSQRLLDWMLKGKLSKYRTKAVVIPHLAMDLPSPDLNEQVPVELNFDLNYFNLVHTGTLLGPRQPWALFEAFRNISEINPEFSRTARIYMIGKIDSQHKKDARWQEIISMYQTHIFEERLSYQQALAIAKASSVLILLEAVSHESPFFPAKLADYLWAGKPILALSPVQSTVVDFLGNNYFLRANPDDVNEIQKKIYQTWTDWKQGKMSNFLPDTSPLELLTESRVMVDLDNLLNSVCNIH